MVAIEREMSGYSKEDVVVDVYSSSDNKEEGGKLVKIPTPE